MMVIVANPPDEYALIRGHQAKVVSWDFVPGNQSSEDNPLVDVEIASGVRFTVRLRDLRPVPKGRVDTK